MNVRMYMNAIAYTVQCQPYELLLIFFTTPVLNITRIRIRKGKLFLNGKLVRGETSSEYINLRTEISKILCIGFIYNSIYIINAIVSTILVKVFPCFFTL